MKHNNRNDNVDYLVEFIQRKMSEETKKRIIVTFKQFLMDRWYLS